MDDRPVIFVASSSEQLPVAYAIRAGLYEPRQWEVRVWDTQFDFSSAYIESLEKALDAADFAVVVMTGDDAANVRKNPAVLPRDNVIFELGLFIGRLGRERCAFFVDATSQTRIASDLSGVKAADYYPADQALGKQRPGLADRVRALKKQVREQLRAQGVRYKPDAEQREQQQERWRFLKQIEGQWWERMRRGDDDQSALSLVTIELDAVSNTPRLNGRAYALDGSLLASWDAVADLALGSRPTLSYRWEGQHESEQGAKMGGQGVIRFDALERPQIGDGYFFDTRLAEIKAGLAPTRQKRMRLCRLDAQDLAAMQDPLSAAARQRVCERSDALRWD